MAHALRLSSPGHLLCARSRLHGEAVAIGMVGAARISQEMGLLTAAVVSRVGADVLQ
ncbi:MAG: hypothetical protein HY689_15240 [Chloroflexi bacterium]|nr:hypothetical protein [Chloroflexota bacterium]